MFSLTESPLVGTTIGDESMGTFASGGKDTVE